MQRRDQAGAVTAEAAVVLPMLAAVAFALAWLISLAVVESRVEDAAREGARVVARGDSTAAAVAQARQVAPSGAVVRIRRGSGEVVVEVTAPVRGPGGLLRALPSVRLHARAVAATETGGSAP